MARRRERITLVCEDKQQSVFIREYLRCCGFDINPNKMTIDICPQGKGSGEQYVREKFVAEVRTFRQKAKHTNSVLIFAIDADTKSVQDRFNELDDLLKEARLSERSHNEKIAICIPKRNIETWIYYARGEAVDESNPYPKLKRERECKRDVRHLAKEICPKRLPDSAPPSLFTACEELNRILN